MCDIQVQSSVAVVGLIARGQHSLDTLVQNHAGAERWCRHGARRTHSATRMALPRAVAAVQ